MSLVVFDPREFAVRFVREGVMLDLGAIGKGYAVEQAASVLREAGVTSALIHGGTSTAYAIGCPPDADCWKVAIDRPLERGQPCPPEQRFLLTTRGQGCPRSERLLTSIPLKDEALSVSAVWGRSFELEGKVYGHEIDPRTGWPANAAVLAAVASPSATESDALSTALVTVGLPGHESIACLRPNLRTLVVAQSEAGLQIAAQGITVGSAIPPGG